ncbi:MAG: Unknown protein [uncultured Sulfurovum sp.]|uniref:Uncharacterized protein n=1 Tax=uncultured Sulfurovum sp. TaxID=269237 RepID=A0A6S6SE73_9BACT|nr:MAG: Unknown protein [uncultured Sulfurovum sp.]
MSWFQNTPQKKIYPTKMFVNYLTEVTQKNGSIQTKSLTAAIAPIALDMVLTAAPKLADQGINFVAHTLESLAIDKAFPTIVRRNFDVIKENQLSLPRKITIVRGDFAHEHNKQGEIFGDGEDKNDNQVILLANKELHIEIDIIQSKDKSALYFQASSYFYLGKSPEGHNTDEIVLSFAFLPAGQSIVNPEKDFQHFLHFEALKPKQQYNFKSKSGYDCSFQSAWISQPLQKVSPYTMVIQIQEIREGNSFAKLLQTVYLENEQNIKNRINTKISTAKEAINEK